MPIIIFIFISFSAMALELKAPDGKSFSFVTKGVNRVSPLCKRTCNALENYSQKTRNFKPLGGNPASELCTHLGGMDRTLSYPNRDQDSVCFFKDESYIISWDLFRKNMNTK